VTSVTPGWPGWPIAACQPIGELGPEMLNRVREKMDDLHWVINARDTFTDKLNKYTEKIHNYLIGCVFYYLLHNY